MRGHGIEWERNIGGGASVSTARSDQPLIPLLLDARSEYGVVEVTPVNAC
jgi:hypothetical protein